MHHPIDEQIALRAYEFWEQRGRPWGTPEVDWFKAAGELATGESKSRLSAVAREVGSVVGRVVTILNDCREELSGIVDPDAGSLPQ